MRRTLNLLLLLLALLAAGAVGRAGVPSAQAQDASDDRILAVAGRQVVWLDQAAPRPRPLTRLAPPANAVDIAAMPDWPTAVVSVTAPFPGGGARGADLVLLDLDSGALTPLASRTDATESLVAPAWWPDGSAVLFERDDLTGRPVGAPGQEVPRYPSRIEAISIDSQARVLLTADGRQPSPAPDGSHVVFARTTSQGASLLVWTNGEGTEQTLVAAGRFVDVAYPRYSPAGDQIAFVAPQSGLNSSTPFPGLAGRFVFAMALERAHGIPWDPWVMNVDGSGLRRAAVVGGDEPSVSWSPDGSRLFVYSGTGSAVVDLATGETTPLTYITGYGPTAWLPSQLP